MSRPVRFLKDHRHEGMLYRAGKTYTLRLDLARDLCARGIARFGGEAPESAMLEGAPERAVKPRPRKRRRIHVARGIDAAD